MLMEKSIFLEEKIFSFTEILQENDSLLSKRVSESICTENDLSASSNRIPILAGINLVPAQLFQLAISN